jgi:hypothetical protein
MYQRFTLCVMAQIPGYSYSTIAFGNSEWLREMGSPLAKEIESLVPYRSGDIPDAMRAIRC